MKTTISILALAISAALSAAESVKDAALPTMLAGDWVPTDTHQIDYAKLPRVPGEHVVVSDVREQKGVNQHNYLAFHAGRYFVMWSDGPGIEDRVGQRVKFATSLDGLKWNEPKFLTPIPPSSGPDSPHYGTRTDKGMRWISRGFWQRDGEMYALAALDEAAGFFGPSLALHAFQWNPAGDSWEDTGVIAEDAINNFPPKRIPSGEWMMSRRPHDYSNKGVDFYVGGVTSMRDWKAYPVLGTSAELKAEEPLWWVLPDNQLMALFRDNRGSKFLYRATSADNGRNWSAPARTNFPDATSKLHGLRLSDGRYVLVSNSNPRARDPLTLAISDDGWVFNKLAYLVGGRHVDYPHAIEHDAHLLVAFAGGKQTVEVIKIKLADLDGITMPSSVALATPLPAIAKPTVTASDWIDLGSEDASFYLTADITIPKRGQTAALSLATSSGQERVTVGVDAAGKLLARLYEHEVKGSVLPEGVTLSLLVHVVSHAKKPDELFVQTGPAGSIPPPPASRAEWTLINDQGRSDANLSRVMVQGSSAANVRVAATYASLASAKPVKTTLLKPAPSLDLTPPDASKNPGSALMLAGNWVPENTQRIDFAKLPRLPSEHAIVSDVLPKNGGRVNQHNYLVYHGGKFWAMWSDGPGISHGYGKVPSHDLPGQHVSFAISEDGLKWSAIGNLTGAPEEGFGWIARGFWMRDGQLLALASRYAGTGYRGDGLQLHAFTVTDGEAPVWKHLGMVQDNTLNNFPPEKLPSGQWMMSRRDKDSNVHVLVGGTKSFDDWQSFPQATYQEPGLAAEEPDWWVLPDNNLCALFRDNKRSGYLYRGFSTDEGRTWTKPARTNFPDAGSKFSSARLQDGRYVLVSNPHPKTRNPLTLAISDDGLVFNKLFWLAGDRHVDYPHIIEYDGALYIAFATAKQTCEVLKVKLSDVDIVPMPDKPLMK